MKNGFCVCNASWRDKSCSSSTNSAMLPLSQAGAELLFEVFSHRYERGATIVTQQSAIRRVDERVRLGARLRLPLQLGKAVIHPSWRILRQQPYASSRSPPGDSEVINHFDRLSSDEKTSGQAEHRRPVLQDAGKSDADLENQRLSDLLWKKSACRFISQDVCVLVFLTTYRGQW